MAEFPSLQGDEWQADPAFGLSEHAKAIAEAAVDKERRSADGLWRLATASDSALTRLLATRELMTGGWCHFVPIAASQQDRVLDLVRDETSQFVYQPYMDFLTHNFDIPELRARGLEALRHISITSPSPVRRYLALASLLRARSNLPESFPPESANDEPWVDRLVRDRVLSDESNYVRATIASDVLDRETLDAPALTKFCVQWFLHNQIFPPSRRYDYHWWPKQQREASFFSSERRSLLAAEAPGALPQGSAPPAAESLTSAPFWLLHPFRAMTQSYGIGQGKVFSRRHLFGIDRGGPDLELHRVTRVFPVGRLYGKVVFYDEVSEAVVWNDIVRPRAVAKTAEAIIAEARRRRHSS